MDERKKSEMVGNHQGRFWGARCSRRRFYPLLVLLIGVLVYSNTLEAPFAFDDDYYIANNPATSDFGYFLDSSKMERGIAAGQLDQNFRSRRVAAFSFSVNYWLDGLKVKGYHLFNILLHLLNGLLVYWLVVLTLRTPFLADAPSSERLGDNADKAALLVALFFVAHPVQTEAVTYVAQRFTSMATTFYLLALDLFIAWRSAIPGQVRKFGGGRPGAGWLVRSALYGLALLSVLLAMFTKEIAFTLPVTIILYDGMFFGWKRGWRQWALLPFLFSLAIIPATILGGGAKYMDMVSLTASLSQPMAGNPALTYLFTQFRVIVTYLRLLLLPLNQNIDYDYPRYTGFFQAPVTISFVFLFLLVGTAVYLYRCAVRQPAGTGRWQRLIAFGIGWFFLTLSVESSFIPLKDLIFEHRLYLPSVGFLLAMLGGVEIARSRFAPLRSTWALLLLVVLLVTLALAAYNRNNLWRDPILLWEDAARKSPDKLRTHNNLGNLYEVKGWLPEAEREFLQSLKIDSRAPETHMVLGAISMRLGKIDKAQEYFDQSARLDPSNPKLYCLIGKAFAKKGDYKSAETAFLKSLLLNPDDPETRQKLELVRQLLDNAVVQKDALKPLKTAGY